MHETYPTSYAKRVENFGGGIKSGRMGQVNYWLRPTITSSDAVTVHMGGYYFFSSITGVKRYSTDNQDREVGVRPVICIDLDKTKIKERIKNIKNEPQYVIDFNKQKLMDNEVVDNKLKDLDIDKLNNGEYSIEEMDDFLNDFSENFGKGW